MNSKYLNVRTAGLKNDAHENSARKEGAVMSHPTSDKINSNADTRNLNIIVDREAS